MEFIINLALWIIGLIILWRMISRGFKLGNRIAVASEATAMATMALFRTLSPEAQAAALDSIVIPPVPAKRFTPFRFLLGTIVVLIAVFIVLSTVKSAPAQVQRDQPTSTFRDERGRTTGTASTDSQGTTTFRDERGRTIGTSTRPRR